MSVYRHLHEDEATHPPVYGDGLVEGEAKQPRPQPVTRGRYDDEEAIRGGDVAPRVCDVPVSVEVRVRARVRVRIGARARARARARVRARVRARARANVTAGAGARARG